MHGNLSLWYSWICSYWANYEIWITWVIWAVYCYIQNSLGAKQGLNFRTGKWLKKHCELFCSITDSQLYWQFIWTLRLIQQMLTLQKTWVQCALLTQYMYSCPQLFVGSSSSQTIWIWFRITGCSAKLYTEKYQIIKQSKLIVYPIKTGNVFCVKNLTNWCYVYHWSSKSSSFW